MAEPIVELLGVSRRYGSNSGRVDALIDVDLQVSDGDWLAIVGPSGSGKSTLLNIVGCLDVQTGGIYLFHGIDVATLTDPSGRGLRSRRHRLRVPGLPPARAPDGHRERDARRHLPARAARTAAPGGPPRCWSRSASRTGPTSAPARCRAASASGWRSPAPCSARPSCCSATSRPATSTRPRPHTILDLFAELNAGGVTVVMITHDPT